MPNSRSPRARAERKRIAEVRRQIQARELADLQSQLDATQDTRIDRDLSAMEGAYDPETGQYETNVTGALRTLKRMQIDPKPSGGRSKLRTQRFREKQAKFVAKQKIQQHQELRPKYIARSTRNLIPAQEAAASGRGLKTTKQRQSLAGQLSVRSRRSLGRERTAAGLDVGGAPGLGLFVKRKA